MSLLAGRSPKGRVFLVGAGPGDPELLTLRALKILRTADVILHDDLVPPEILALVSGGRIENVGKRCGAKRVSQEEINARMIHLARGGFAVARLKSGDPSIFGRAGEEMSALWDAGIDFEIVPGVTAACSAAARAGIALTDRRNTSQVLFVSAHHSVARPVARGHDWGDRNTVTWVIHMPGDDHAELARELLASGRSSDTPCVLVSNAGRTGERIVATSVGNLAQAPQLPSPKILIVGDVAARTEIHDARQRSGFKADSNACVYSNPMTFLRSIPRRSYRKVVGSP